VSFDPIAIVGQGAVLPGALSPAALADLVFAGRSAVGPAPAGRFRLPREHALGTPERSQDRTWSDAGGYVEGFDARFDASGFALDAATIRALDPSFRWLVDAGRQALAPLGGVGAAKRAGLVIGNLSFPTASMSAFAEETWLGAPAGRTVVDARCRFMSGLPALVGAKALGLELGGYALDAACASSLYAIELACHRLHDRLADVMLAGAVNGSDALFLHVGFCALGAMSRTGQSRPFHRGADGLVPAEGAALVTLMRLEDARAKGLRVLGVIRGVGLSNDGRGRGLLTPSEEGQIRAMRLAYAESGLSPRDVSLVECHATGTPVGDGTEIRSMRALFEGASGVPIGSLKSNLGHLITAAGVAGLLKVLAAFEAGERPPTLATDAPIDALAGSPFRLLDRREPWASTGPRVAAVSAFGFGGNNAHLLVREDDGAAPVSIAVPAAKPAVAIVALAARVGRAKSTVESARALLSGAPFEGRHDDVTVALAGLKFPPRDFEATLAQQTLLLEVAREVAARVELPRERTGVFVGMGADAEVARYGLRWRLAGIADAMGAPAGWLEAARDAVVPVLEAAGVVGTMPNIPANRVSSQLDLGGPGFVLSAEEASGVVALEVAARALRAGDLDVALVGAVDASDEAVHRAALAALGIDGGAGDAAVMLVLEREADARAKGHRVLAVLDDVAREGALVVGEGPSDPLRGATPHAAAGLLHVAAATAAIAHATRPGLASWEGPRSATTRTRVLGGEAVSVHLREGDAATPILDTSPAPAGPTLTLPAHPPAVKLPPMPMNQTQVMRPAPKLPPVVEGAATRSRDGVLANEAVPAGRPPAGPPVPSDVRAAASGRMPIGTTGGAPLPPSASTGLPLFAGPSTSSTDLGPELRPVVGFVADDVLARATATQAHLGALHRGFLEAQAAVHQRFLAMQHSMLASLTTTYATAMASGTVEAAPEPPIAAYAPPPIAAYAPPPIAPAPIVTTPVVAPPVVAAPAPLPEPPRPATPAAPAPAVARPPAPAQPLTLAPAPAPKALPGPKFSRAQLEVLASGAISSVFGPEFADQDGYARQVRMPEPPLLLADRVTGIDAVPHSMKLGTIWTETDVREDSWYLHEGRMPAGVMIESGQADLLLISWLGIDRLNRGERIYRLLGCELTYHGELPKPGETLSYDIHVDGHAQHGDVRLFFFHYDCRVNGELRLSVRGGQAGFFTDQELAESGGILWDAATGEHSTKGPLDPPQIACTKSRFSEAEVKAFSEGRVVDCFGPGYERAHTHVRTPRISGDRMLFLREVTSFDPTGGPWGRGYLRAETPITPEDWTFAGHFKNDPCMPGTLMFEGCLQAMAFYLAAMGFTVDRDGWRFEPVTGDKIPMRCRGQVIPSSKHLTYEVFIEEVVGGPVPMAYADLLCTVDGLKAFHARRVGLRLVPAWPLDEWQRLPYVSGSDPAHEAIDMPKLGGLVGYVEPTPVAVVNGFPFDYKSMIACAWGRPSEAFGPMYLRFDSARSCARLPGAPYHFISRVVKADAPIGVLKPGGVIVTEYDIPEGAWYFDVNGAPVMPFAVLLEAALQPCGWLASYVGSALTTDVDLLFRNLDGKATQHVELVPTSGTLRTTVKITDISRSAGMIIESFDVKCHVGETLVYSMTTVFGFFPREAFVNQVGLPVTPEDRARLEAPSSVAIDLEARPAKYFGGTLRLAEPMLCMLDRVTACDLAGGKKGLGYARAEKDVDPAEWFFKCHFFQDPVQPGSLGVEALIQLLQLTMIERGMGDGIESPRFEALGIEKQSIWKYRGQVVPSNKRITTEIDVLEVGEDDRGRFAVAEGSLWVDGKRIYHMPRFAMRIVPGGSPPRPRKRPGDAEETLDPSRDAWLGDHRPTWTLPALPMMSMVDRLAGAVKAGAPKKVVELRNVEVKRWLPFQGAPVRLRTDVDGDRATLSAFREARDPSLSRFEPVAAGTVVLADAYPPAPAARAPLSTGSPAEIPYATGGLFHGPAFHHLTAWQLGGEGSTATLDCALRGVPHGALHQGLLDAMTHAIPHDELARFSPEIAGDVVGYPYRIPSLRLFGELPTSGEARLETRFVGFDGDKRFPKLEVELSVAGRVVAALELVEILLPKGPIGAAPREDRRAFLRDRAFRDGVGLARVEGDATIAATEDVRPSDWLPGNVATIYAASPADLVAEVSVRDHVARLDRVHPSDVRPSDDLASAVTASRPLRRHALSVQRNGDAVRVTSAAPPRLDLAPVEAYWRKAFATGAWPVEDLYYGMIERFVGDVVYVDPAAHEAMRGRSCLYLANHQTGVESLLFSVIASGLSGVSTVTLAKAEHRGTWVGDLIRRSFSYPGIVDPRLITYFDREDRESLVRIIGELAEEMRTTGKSVMVHVEGTRAFSCRAPVVKMSSAFIDMALAVDAPIVPVRFLGGLPVDPLAVRTEFPVGPGRQDIWLGKPLLPKDFAGVPLKERKMLVIDAINALGCTNDVEEPHAADLAFGARAERWREATGTTPERATLLATLEAMPAYRADDTRRLVEAAARGEVVRGAGPSAAWLEAFSGWLLGRV
jgi:3-oxoacyl-(acyl-carrier-protein) synthase/3-hydroxymyristoyl/3-hydroxydecanoyl-(acyl carrier protein) dehydratase/1-acyl-sn-glycerol-3-phosphate acyltransferase